MEKALGRHLLLECYDCAIEPLNQVVFMEQMMRQAASLLEVNMIDSHFHHFAPYGVSGVIIIEESHLTLHTWPEYQYAAIDFFTCGPTADPQIAINYLQEVLNAERVRESWIPRGALSILPNPPLSLERNTQITRHRGERQVWFTDRDENVAISLRHKGDLLFQKQSDLQLVEVYDTFEFGKMLSLDSVIMCTEKDEPGYHEMLVHVPVQSFPNPLRRVLIIGGGDGGTARELIRYGQVEQIILVEIDPVVIEAVKNHI
ncbi:MAG: adenosylmethionine decarboxylase, partial [Bacteroidota bacterium]